MAGRGCSIAGCLRPVAKRGWCGTHYQRWRRHGDPLHESRIVGDTHRRLWSQVAKHEEGGCWEWMGATNDRGYGIIRVAGRTEYVHRLVWAQQRSTPIAGMTLDHECHNQATPPCSLSAACPHRRCCNPAHLREVPLSVNILAGQAPSARNARKTHCPQGHLYDESNTRMQRDGGRVCRACQRAWGQRRAQKLRAT